MRMAVFLALGLLLFSFICAWLITFLRYHVSPRHLKITWLGICLRRIRLEKIQSVSKRRPTGWAENWCNTFRPGHRRLVIRRVRGLRRSIMITPTNRYIFKTALEKAIAQKTGVTVRSVEESAESDVGNSPEQLSAKAASGEDASP